MGILDDFKTFLTKSNVISMATAFVVGLAVTALVMAVVNDLINPLIASALNVNFSELGVVYIGPNKLQFGSILGAVINFLILLAVVFFIFVYPYEKAMARMKKQEAATTRKCPMCQSEISVAATRCAFCTSTVTPTAPAPA